MIRLRILPALAVLAALGCAAGPEPSLFPDALSEGYSLVVDAGSQGSRLRIYRWSWAAGEALPEIRAAPWPRGADEHAWDIEVVPGLSAYAGDAEAAARTLAPLIESGLRKLGLGESSSNLPAILVLATAGVRQLPQEQQDEIVAEVRRFLRRRGFRRTRVRVLSGREEALFGWLGGNFTLGRLSGAEGQQAVGGLDLGGASTQIAFATAAQESDDVELLRLGESDFRVFVRSDLGFGQDAAEADLADASCYPPGYLSPAGEGRGDYALCHSGLVEAFRHCEGASCPPRAATVPRPEGRFVGVANYYYTSVMFGLAAPLSLAELEAAGERYCATEWDEIRRQYPRVQPKYLARYCFSTAYIVALLTEGYGFPFDTEAIIVIDRIGGEKIAWTLGALLYELTR